MLQPSTITFREIAYGSDDYRRECELRNNVLRRPLGRSLYDEDLSGESTQRHFGLFAGDALIASVIAAGRSPEEVRIRQMAVSFESQRRGHGRRIIEHLEEELAQRGCVHAWMHARATAIGFYEKLGYVRVGAEFTEIGLPHIKMEKRLAKR